MTDTMRDVKTLGELLPRLADVQSGIRFLQGGGNENFVPYRELLSRARGLLAHFRRCGVEAGDAVLLFVQDNRAFVDAFWACQLGGLVAVPLSAGVQSEYLHKLAAVAAKFDTPFLFTQRKLWQRLPDVADRAALFAGRVALIEEITQLDGDAGAHPAGARDTALVQFSSGSTSEPKGVVLSHANLLANVRAIVAAAHIGDADVTLSWMPLSHDMGLIGFHLVPLYLGLQQVLMDTDLFVRRPARWLQAAQRYGASLLCAPNFGYQHYLRTVPRDDDNLDLSRVRLMFNGAEPVSAPVCRAFAQRLAGSGFEASAFFPVYGLAEASLAVTFPQPGSGIMSLRLARQPLAVGATVARGDDAAVPELVCLGHPVDGCELRICDDAGTVLPDNTLGHVQVRGVSVTRGYFRCPACDAAALRDGWLDTGDLGFVNGQGLFIAGRCKEVLFVSGQNRFPQDIEQLLQQHAGIEAGKVAVAAARSDDNAEDRLLVFVRYRRDPDTFAHIVQRVQAALAEHAGLHAHAVIPLHSLPRTTSGKLQRVRLAQAFAAGEYAQWPAQTDGTTPRAEAPSDSVERQLLDVCARLFPDRSIQPGQNLFELGADSLMLVRIHDEVETRFPGRVEITDLFEHPTIASLAAYIERRSVHS